MDNAFNLSSTKIIRALAEAEVMSIFFPHAGKALIIDTRHDAENGPAVFVDEMVGSPEERLQSIRRLRPQFKELAQLTLAPWFGSTRTFAEQGILEAIVERFHALGFPGTADEAMTAFRQLRRAETATLRDLITGDPQTTRTVWARQS
jgi:hypothetical protein